MFWDTSIESVSGNTCGRAAVDGPGQDSPDSPRPDVPTLSTIQAGLLNYTEVKRKTHRALKKSRLELCFPRLRGLCMDTVFEDYRWSVSCCADCWFALWLLPEQTPSGTVQWPARRGRSHYWTQSTVHWTNIRKCRLSVFYFINTWAPHTLYIHYIKCCYRYALPVKSFWTVNVLMFF